MKRKIFRYGYRLDIYSITIENGHAQDIHFHNGCLYFTTMDEMKILEINSEGSTIQMSKNKDLL
ncbi:MAG TPA: hypothetical protein PKC30_00505 [Saprospiraceae bacterium]|nr:hypothetical protein [Saprospiraceae bacterium]